MKISIYYPVKPSTVNQAFGVVDPKYTALGMLGHNGIDFAATHGQPVYAAHDGNAYYDVDSANGHIVVIRTLEAYDFAGGLSFFKTMYGHLCDQTKEPQFTSPVIFPLNDFSGVGQPVKEGDLIGYADSTGLSTGDHLHFGLKPIALAGEYPGTWDNTLQTNGYNGCIDPTPFFNGQFAEDIQTEQQIVQVAAQAVNVIATSNEPNPVKVDWLDKIKEVLSVLLKLIQK